MACLENRLYLVYSQARVPSTCSTINTGSIWLTDRRGWGVSKGGPPLATIVVQYLFKFIFINKVYQFNFKHLTEFILTVSNQPYLQINHQLNT